MTDIWVPWLAAAARLTGYPVVEVDGWRTRGHGGFRSLEGVLLHHTADGPGEYPSLRVVRDGRADLPGPLSNYGLGRSGTVYVIAAGVAWHAGASRWAGFTDLNNVFLGIEAESRGTVDDWTPEQRDAYPRLVAAALTYMCRKADRAAGHREVCLPPGRKIDPAFWDLPALRERVAWLLADPLVRIPFRSAAPVAAAPLIEEDSMDLPASTTPRSHTLIVPTDARTLVISLGWTSMSAEVAFFGATPVKGSNPVGKRLSQKVDAARPWEITIPAGAITAEINYTLPPIEGREVHAGAAFRR